MKEYKDLTDKEKRIYNAADAAAVATVAAADAAAVAAVAAATAADAAAEIAANQAKKIKRLLLED